MTPAPPPAPTLPGGTEPPAGTAEKIDFLVVYGHSNLLYWWPVWLVAFILAAVSYSEGNQMAVVPDGSVVATGTTVAGFDGPRDVVVAPAGKSMPLAPVAGAEHQARMTVSGNNTLGVVFVATLFVVALTSTILLRGLVSVIAVALVVVVVVTFALLDWWNPILAFVGGLDIRMNAAGYLAIAVPLFLAWLVVVMFYDRAHYIIFDQGQIRYVREVGDSEIVVQSDGALVEKKRNDVFRHWLLGFGTGDLLIRTGGGNGQTIELENVLNIGRKLTVINQMIREKAITVES